MNTSIFRDPVVILMLTKANFKHPVRTTVRIFRQSDKKCTWKTGQTVKETKRQAVELSWGRDLASLGHQSTTSIAKTTHLPITRFGLALGRTLNSRCLMGSVTGRRTFWRNPRRNRFSGRMRLQTEPHCRTALYRDADIRTAAQLYSLEIRWWIEYFLLFSGSNNYLTQFASDLLVYQ